MYQCFASNEWEQIQSTAELQLGGPYRSIPWRNLFDSMFSHLKKKLISNFSSNPITYVSLQMQHLSYCIGFPSRPCSRDRQFH